MRIHQPFITSMPIPFRSMFVRFMSVLFLFSVMPTSASENDYYQLDSGDTISITVFGEPELSKQILLNNRGIINYPFIGEIKVKGLTLAEVEQAIHKGLQGDYLINPNVSVVVVKYRQFYIEGEVKSSGGYAYQPGLTVSKAVALAGGFTERASQDKIFIIRATDPTQTQVKVTKSTLIRPGDIITIKQSFF